jgi:hypothetical protein
MDARIRSHQGSGLSSRLHGEIPVRIMRDFAAIQSVDHRSAPWIPHHGAGYWRIRIKASL